MPRRVAVGLFCLLALAGCAGEAPVLRQSGIADDGVHAARAVPRPGPRGCRWPALDNPALGARLVEGSLSGSRNAPRQAVLFRCRGGGR